MREKEIIEEMWDILKEYIPPKDKQAAADHIMPFIINEELPDSDFNSLIGSDPHLEEAAAECDTLNDNDDDDDGEW